MTVGNPAVMELSPVLSAPGADGVGGYPQHQGRHPGLALLLFREERSIAGCWMGSTNLKNDIPKLVNMYQTGKLKLDEFITKHYKLEDIDEAMEAVEQGKALRNVIIFD